VPIANVDRSQASAVADAAEIGRLTPSTGLRVETCGGDAPWKPSSQPAWLTAEIYHYKIQPLLAKASSSAIAAKIGVSRWYAGRIRRGYLPHPRHWLALAKLVGN
jgi:hypothetical protein